MGASQTEAEVGSQVIGATQQGRITAKPHALKVQ
jgi:hypothetical protein